MFFAEYGVKVFVVQKNESNNTTSIKYIEKKFLSLAILGLRRARVSFHVKLWTLFIAYQVLILLFVVCIVFRSLLLYLRNEAYTRGIKSSQVDFFLYNFVTIASQIAAKGTTRTIEIRVSCIFIFIQCFTITTSQQQNFGIKTQIYTFSL